MIKVAQCWDDGVLNDLRLVELLRKYNAKATFNLNPALHEKSRRKVDGTYKFKGVYVAGKLSLDELTDVYEGFQVASHTMHHKNAGQVPDEEFMADAIDARKYLEDRFQRECRGFAWPCGRYTPETMKLMHEAGFAYGRTTQNTDTVIPCEDTMALHSSCHFLNPDFWTIFEKAKETGVFYFWGHSYQMMDEKKLWQETEEKLKRLDADPDVVWVDVIDLVK